MILKDIILSLTLVAAVFVPTWLLVRASGKTRRFLIKELKRINGMLPETYDIWARRAVALHNQRLIFLDLHHQKEEVVDLKTIESCYLLLNNQKFNGGSVDMKKADTLELALMYEGKTIKLNFYDSNADDPVEGGQNVVMAKKWQEITHKSLKQKVLAAAI